MGYYELIELRRLSNICHKAIHNKTLVNGSLFSLFSFFRQGTSFLLLIILANYIQPKEYGRLSLFTTVVTFVGFIMAFSTRGYPSVTYFKKNTEGFKKDFSATIILGFSNCQSNCYGMFSSYLFSRWYLLYSKIIFGSKRRW